MYFIFIYNDYIFNFSGSLIVIKLLIRSLNNIC